MINIYVLKTQDLKNNKAYQLSKQVKLPKAYCFSIKEFSELLLEEDILLLDSAPGLEEIMVIKDLDEVKSLNLKNLNNLNLSFMEIMKLLKLKDIKIIVLPNDIKKEEFQKFINNNL